jgi:hypothetical protein
MAVREECEQTITALHKKLEVAESNHLKINEKRDTDYRKLARQVPTSLATTDNQVQRLKNINEDQRKEMLSMVEAHDRLQRAAAEMNALRTRNFLANPDIASLSQQLSQLPTDTAEQSDAASSPVSHRSKRSRVGETPLRRRSQRVPLSSLKNRTNVSPIKETPLKGKVGKRVDEECMGSVTQSQEGVEDRHVPLKSGIVDSEYGDLIVDEDGFSQFDIL